MNSRVEQRSARMPHKHEVDGSNPSSASKSRPAGQSGVRLIRRVLHDIEVTPNAGGQVASRLNSFPVAASAL